jgi:hypothetical protein
LRLCSADCEEILIQKNDNNDAADNKTPTILSKYTYDILILDNSTKNIFILDSNKKVKYAMDFGICGDYSSRVLLEPSTCELRLLKINDYRQ